MIKISRLWLTVIVLTFGLFVTVQGALRSHNFHNSALALSSSVIYLLCLLLTALAYRSTKLPAWIAWLNIAATGFIPITLHAIHIGEMNGNSDTWFVTALALLFGSMAVREQMRLAIFATILLVVEVIALNGFGFVSRSGLAGAVLLVAASIAISIGLDRSAAKINELQELTAAEKRDTLVSEASREQHRLRIDAAIEKVLPTLQHIASETELSDDQRAQASQLAQVLEDEITGGRLVTDEIKAATALARSRGVEVTLVDEYDSGEQIDDELETLLPLVTTAMSEVQVGRIKLIATKDTEHLLRLTVTRPGVVTPDLDLKLGERQF